MSSSSPLESWTAERMPHARAAVQDFEAWDRAVRKFQAKMRAGAREWRAKADDSSSSSSGDAVQRFEDWRRRRETVAAAAAQLAAAQPPRRSARPAPGPKPRPDEYVGANAQRAITQAVRGNRRRR